MQVRVHEVVDGMWQRFWLPLFMMPPFHVKGHVGTGVKCLLPKSFQFADGEGVSSKSHPWGR